MQVRSRMERASASAILVIVAAGCGSLARNDNSEGVKLYQQGNYQGAVNSFQQALAKQPGSPDGFYNIGATYHQQAKLFGRPQDMQLAEQYYHLCLARSPDHPSCQRALAVLLVEQNRGNEAVANLEAWSRRQPGDPQPRIELARLCEEHGDAQAAENHLVDALAVDPNNPRALVALGQLRESSGNTQQALANYTRALSIDGRQPMVAARVASLSSGGSPTVVAPGTPPPGGVAVPFVASPPAGTMGPGGIVGPGSIVGPVDTVAR